MACSIEERLIDTLKDEVKGKATSYKLESKRVFIPFNPNSQFIKKLDQAVEIAKGKVLKINEKYNKWANGNVVSVDSTPKNGVYINIHPTQDLIDAYNIEEERKIAEETEKEALLFIPEQLYSRAIEISDESVKGKIKQCE